MNEKQKKQLVKTIHHRCTDAETCRELFHTDCTIKHIFIFDSL